MSGRWFESVAAAERRARRRLPRSVFAAVRAGSERGLTMTDNVAAFDELGFRPVTADRPAHRNVRTTVMGQELALPVVLSPTGVQAIHPGAEVAVARGAAARGTAFGLSCFASQPIEAVVAANPRTFVQLHWIGGRAPLQERLDRARRAGAVGAILTLDWSFSHSRDWGSPHIPEVVSWREAVRFAPEVAVRPAWTWSFARAGRIPDLRVPNQVAVGRAAPTFFETYRHWAATAPPSWSDIAWLRQQWDGPFMVKGVGRPDEARKAVDAGATAISVSNHGGNNLDGTPGAVRLLPAVAEAVGDQVEVLLDGGIRRGSDVAKALALGARAVMIGRPYLWGLAANGQAGVENVLDILRDGLDSTLLALGHSSVDALGLDDLIVPAGFRR